MHKKLRLLGVGLLAAIAVIAFGIGLSHGTIDVLSPAGSIASSQKRLFIAVILTMLVIVIPVFVLTIAIAWKYRASNPKNTDENYQPEWDHNAKLETLWWGLPCVIILMLSILAWTSSHRLDPAQPLASTVQPITIQVVALQWKWLFIYPEQKIATVNYVQFPAGTPVNFQITADAPMNSFWIPRLGGQIYAMAGMTTQLHLMADKPGAFHGSSANLSGKGFSDMQFIAESRSRQDFDSWVRSTQQGPGDLSLAAYTALAQPNVPKTSMQFAAYEPGLYDTVLMKYMAHSNETMTMQGMSH